MQKGPFSLDQARAHGVTKAQLLGKRWLRLGHGVYVSREVHVDPLVTLQAALLRLPAGVVFSGRTAAFLHGLDSQCSCIEAMLPPTSRITRRTGISIRRCQLAPDEVAIRKGLPVTSALRTTLDLCCRLGLVEAVVVLDAVLHRKLIRLGQLRPRRGYRGVAQLRRALELAEPKSESPMETRLRLALQLAGLPRPHAQVA